ncbi:hypothetical protein KY332_01705 [Candidatus Woesearchaeota archaeon]|nr:hypothetical protein [Candidatus Woesearchaeota archaeon]
MGYSSGCGYSCGSSGAYSSLENIVGNYNGGSGGRGIDYMIAAEPVKQFEPRADYFDDVKKEVYSDNYKSVKRVSETYSHSISHFLNPVRPLSVFVGEAKEIKGFVEEAFKALTGQEFPDDIIVRVVEEEEMKKMHPANVLGFAINRKHLGLPSEIFVKKDLLDRLMLTIGHELGHVLTRRLADNKDEEAKAFAFSLAWMKKIKEENIANLSTVIQLDKPAENGVHNVALDFILNLVNKGREAIKVWMGLVKGELNVCEWS